MALALRNAKVHVTVIDRRTIERSGATYRRPDTRI